MLKVRTEKLPNAGYQVRGCVVRGCAARLENAGQDVEYGATLGYTEVLGQTGLLSETSAELRRDKQTRLWQFLSSGQTS